MKNFKVIRKTLTKKSTIGELWIDGTLQCYTLEDVVRELNKLEDKVPGQTAIPYGTYVLDFTWSDRFQCFMPEIMNVPYFKGIRIHSGNTDKDTEGCLLVGSSTGVDFIYDSKKAFRPVMEIILEAHKAGIAMQIEIVKG